MSNHSTYGKDAGAGPGKDAVGDPGRNAGNGDSAEKLSLALIASLPLGWQLNRTVVARHTNPLVLNGEEALQSPVPEPEDQHEWRNRLDAKADLLLAHSVLARVDQPPLKVTPIELYADHIRWVGPVVEGMLEMWLQIHPLAPPLVLMVRADGDNAVFLDLDPETAESLERLIFRHHRRQIKARKER